MTRNSHSSGSLGTPCQSVYMGDGHERWSRRDRGSDVVPHKSSSSEEPQQQRTQWLETLPSLVRSQFHCSSVEVEAKH
jgi:hypothetical protein